MTAITAGGRTFEASAVVFDKDGTLVRIDPLWAGALGRWVTSIATLAGDATLVTPIRAALGIDEDGSIIPNGIAHAGTTDHAHRAAGRVLVAHGVATPGRILRAACTGRFDPADVVPLGAVGATLTRLAEAGTMLAVATADDRRATMNHLDALGVTHLFHAIVCADDASKPSPRVFAILREILGIPPSEMVMVGDSIVDVETARRGGAGACIGITGDGGRPAGADVAVLTIDEIEAAT